MPIQSPSPHALLAIDHGTRVRLSSPVQSTPIDVIVGDISQTWMTGCYIEVVRLADALAPVNFVPAAGVTLNQMSGTNTLRAGEYGRVSLVESGVWDLHIYMIASTTTAPTSQVLFGNNLGSGATSSEYLKYDTSTNSLSVNLGALNEASEIRISSAADNNGQGDSEIYMSSASAGQSSNLVARAGSSDEGGNTEFSAGDGSNGIGGNITLNAGDGSENFDAGNFSALAGNTSGTAGVAGSILLVAGVNSGIPANSGSISMNIGNALRFSFTPSGAVAIETDVGIPGQLFMSNGDAPPSWVTPANTVAGASTNVQFNNAGVLAGSSKFTWDDATSTLGLNSGTATLKGTADGGNLAITAGSSTTTSGGHVTITAGGTSEFSATPGSATMRGGAKTTSGGAGGSATIIGGNATSQGGNAVMIAGSSTLDGNGGGALLQAGDAAGSGRVGGIVSINSGTSAGGIGGWIEFATADAGTVVQRLKINYNGSWALGPNSAQVYGKTGQMISSNGAFTPPTWKEPQSKPMPLSTPISTSASYDVGSSAHHNSYFRIQSATDATITVRPDSFYTGTQQYWEENFNPTTPGPAPIGAVLKFCKGSTGNLIFVAGPGVTLNTPASLTVDVMNGTVELVKTGANTWDIEGRLASV